MAPLSSRAGRPWAVLLAGLALLAAGAVLARLSLPEWRTGPIPPRALFVQRFGELASAVGWHPAAGAPAPSLVSSKLYGTAAELRRRGALTWIERSRVGLMVEITRPLADAGGGPVEAFTSEFALDGTPYHFSRIAPDPSRIFQAAPEAADGERLAVRLLRPGERLGPGTVTSTSGGGRAAMYPIAGAGDYAVATENWLMREARRAPAKPDIVPSPSVAKLLRGLALLAGGAALFFGLVVRRQISLVNGALVGALALLACAAELTDLAYGAAGNLLVLALVLAQGLWTMVLWSTGESLLRTSQEGMTTSLDALRRGRLGPRAGRALLTGLGAGAAVAGLRLAAAALAARLPGAWPLAPSLSLPAFSIGGAAAGGIQAAALAAFALGLGRRAAPARWMPLAALAVALVALPAAPLHPGWLALAVSLAVAAILVEVGRRAGLTALLTAGIAAGLLPTAVLAAGHLDWLAGTFAAAGGGSAALLALGLAGLARPAEVEEGRMVSPAFIRRLEEERRLRYEMDLLTRMQLGLLPERIPSPAGWEIAARSLIATEAGGDLYDFIRPGSGPGSGPDGGRDGAGPLWIAAGDVAGHGYSCAIVQAMTVSALSSLIVAERTPAGVLAEIDRVLRRGGAQRNFTTLALLRLDPATGEALLANAGHPFPLLLTAGVVREIDLPGLPLGQGPQREYRDVAISVSAGGVLVLASDGLFEGANARGEAYGFERPAAVVRAVARRPAEAILEAILADWRRHLGAEEPADDTTLLVIKRR
jgi:serine phosphatase RsbU (regulator of sigma subunit)